MVGTGVSSQSRNERFFARSRKSRDYAEAYIGYVAQEIPQIDTEIAENSHLWMEASSNPNGGLRNGRCLRLQKKQKKR
jgi:hypothetical protein